jgi:chlorobactene glucosyltransferase
MLTVRPELVWLLPWVALLLSMPLFLVRRTRIRSYAAPPAREAPLVTAIVPARNEAANIGICVASLLNSTYPNLEVVVIDDGSSDGTGDIVRILAEHAGGRLRLVDGEPLPAGWVGKTWACWQGYRVARGELLLFTDADTRHEDALLGHAVGAAETRGADLVSVMPRQLMGSVWERLVLPQIFAILGMRYFALERISRTRNPRHVIANGQFILIRRDAYEAIGGHAAVRSDIVEDQRIAQRMVETGRRIFVAHAQELMETRMYRSLGGIVEGWSKNLARGSRRAAPPWIAPLVPWLIAVFIAGAWLLPPVVLAATVFNRFGSPAFNWSLGATLLSLIYWMTMYAGMRVPMRYAPGYPLGAAVAVALFVRSALRGGRTDWKGRRYESTL